MDARNATVTWGDLQKVLEKMDVSSKVMAEVERRMREQAMREELDSKPVKMGRVISTL